MDALNSFQRNMFVCWKREPNITRFLVSKPIVSLNLGFDKYYNTALDNGLSFFPYRPESKTFVGEFVTVTTDNDEFEYLSEIKIDDDIKEDYMPTTADVETLHEDSGSNYGRFFNQWRR